MSSSSLSIGNESPDRSSLDSGVIGTQPAAAVEQPGSAPQIPGYRVVRPLGGGGQGSVWQAVALDGARKVALKVIRPERMGDERVRARFRQERRILELLDHRNIVRVLDHGELPGGALWHATEYVSGKPLHEYVNELDEAAIREGGRRRCGTFPLETVLRLFSRVCDAVHTAHQVGVIHRDLKPSNVLVDDGGEPHVLDFGVARPPRAEDPEALTLTGEFVGSVTWASPEQVSGGAGAVDERSDVYSLGLVLYHLLTGAYPYDVTGGAATVFDRIRHADPTPPGAYATFIDDELQTVILKCLAKERERRYATAAELRDELERYLRREPIRAKGENSWYALRKFVSRNVALSSGAAVAFVLSLAFGAAMWGLYAQQLAATRRAESAEQDARHSEARALAAERESKRQLAETHAQAARLASQRGDWRAALHNYECALSLGHPDEIRMRLGALAAHDALKHNEETARAIDALLAREDLGPYAAQAWLWRGYVDLLSGDDPESALEAVETALKLEADLNPGDAAFARGLIAERMPDAVASFREALRVDPFHRRARGMLGASLLVSGDRPAAEQELLIAAEMFPEDFEVRCSLAIALALQRRPEEALAELERVRGQVDEALIADFASLVTLLDGALKPFDTWTPLNPGGGDTVRFVTTAAALVARLVRAAPTLEGDARSATSLLIRALPPAGRALWSDRFAAMMALLSGTDDVIERFERIVDASPDGMSYLFYGGALLAADRSAEAADALWEAAQRPAILDIRRVALLSAMTAELSYLRLPPAGRSGFERCEQALRVLGAVHEERMLTPEIAWVAIAGARDLGAIALAREMAEEALREAPRDGRCAEELALTHLADGAYGPAILAAARAMEINPASVRARGALDQAAARLGRIGPPGNEVSLEEFRLVGCADNAFGDSE
ncbi:MAG: protein kinase [Phycisphaerae bacterium]|jgi:serine/threonine protein kinase/Flp pilus assembly protein TadD